MRRRGGRSPPVTLSLNEVRSWRPEQFEETIKNLLVPKSLNEVRSWRPEQWLVGAHASVDVGVSMKSGLGDRNNVKPLMS